MMPEKILKNRTIVITRAAKQAQNFATGLTNHGAVILLFPTVAVVDPPSWETVDSTLNHLHDYDWLVFSSTNGVAGFMKRLQSSQLARFKGKIAAVGRKTARALEQKTLKADVTPDRFSAEDLLTHFSETTLTNQRVLIPTSNLGGKNLTAGFEQLGARADLIEVYHTVPNHRLDLNPFRQGIKMKTIDCLTFFSPSAVSCFQILAGIKTMETVRSLKIPIGVIGRTTAKAVAECGLEVQIQADTSTEEGLVEAIVDYFSVTVPRGRDRETQ